MFKQALLAAAVAATFAAPAAVLAQTAPKSPHTITGNVGLFSQYIFRGLKQTDGDPAVQGGFDYAHESGLYAGTWASNVQWLRDSAQYSSNSLEWDFYGGYKGTFGGDFSYDIGLLQYWYPGTVAAGGEKGNTLELYGQLGWKWLTAKYSYSLGNKTFSVRDSKGTGYFDLSANIPLGDSGFTAVLHWGYQKFKGTDARNAGGASNDSLYSYKDWKLGVTYALPKDFTVGVMWTKAYDANPLGYGSVGQGGVYPNNIATGTGTVFLQKTF